MTMPFVRLTAAFAFLVLAVPAAHAAIVAFASDATSQNQPVGEVYIALTDAGATSIVFKAKLNEQFVITVNVGCQATSGGGTAQSGFATVMDGKFLPPAAYVYACGQESNETVLASSGSQTYVYTAPAAGQHTLEVVTQGMAVTVNSVSVVIQH